MARLNEEQALAMLFNSDFDSGGELEIDEDLAFPLPQPDDIEHSPSPPPRWNDSRQTEESDRESDGRRETSPVSENEVDEERESERGRGLKRGGISGKEVEEGEAEEGEAEEEGEVEAEAEAEAGIEIQGITHENDHLSQKVQAVELW